MKKSGFSMIELLLAMAIGGLLLVGAVPSLLPYPKLGQIDLQLVMHLMHM